jgi:hypothetical protein
MSQATKIMLETVAVPVLVALDGIVTLTLA